MKRKILAFLLLTTFAWSQSQGPTLANAATGNTNTAGGGTVAWTSPTNITACDGSDASIVPGTATTDDLRGGIPFTIPTNAAIVGVQLNVTALTPTTTNAAAWNTVRIESPSTVLVGANRATGTLTPTSTNFQFGGPTDLWATTWTASQINSGFVGNVTEHTATPPGTIDVDCMSATIFFIIPTGSSQMLKVFAQTSWPGAKQPITQSFQQPWQGEALHLSPQLAFLQYLDPQS